MGKQFAFKTLLLLYFLLAMGAQGSGRSAKKMRGEVDDTSSKEKMPMGHRHTDHMNQMDRSWMVFFVLDDLKIGNKIPIYFPKKDPSRSPKLLPRKEADDIPFAYRHYPQLLNFSFSPGSPKAKAMETTLKACELRPTKGETKLCATSMESMLDFVRDMLGWGDQDSEYRVFSTTHLANSSTSTVLLQNYTILETPREIPATKMVACHTMPYPYAVFYCHSQRSESKVFVVSLRGENGDRAEAVAVCHLDTSQWNPNHMSFQVLKVEPGASPVCHFFPQDNLVYVPILPTGNSNRVSVM